MLQVRLKKNASICRSPARIFWPRYLVQKRCMLCTLTLAHIHNCGGTCRTNWSVVFTIFRIFRVFRIFRIYRIFRIFRIFVFGIFGVLLELVKITQILRRQADLKLVPDPPQPLNLPAVRNVVLDILVPSNSKFFSILGDPHFADNPTCNEDLVIDDYVHLRFQPPLRFFEVLEHFHDSVLLLCHRRLRFLLHLLHLLLLLLLRLRVAIEVSLHLTFGPENLTLVWREIEALEVAASSFAQDILPSPWNPIRQVSVGPTDGSVGLRIRAGSLLFRPLLQSCSEVQYLLLALDGSKGQ
mmetsp:Transcript_24926/g.46575  ORF Transcript_24926/g.46575 Transcript_24926/m.46575 type:complete len:297 (-) Transcript_24926:751-1641(-)